jgi:hypothetical protein
MSSHVEDRLSAYLDNELPELERREVDAHLRECPSCGHHLEELAAVDGAFRSQEVDAPQGYFDTLPARIRGRLRQGPRLKAAPWAWAALAAVILLALAPALLLQREGTPRPPQSAAFSPSAREEPAPTIPPTNEATAGKPPAARAGEKEKAKAAPARPLAAPPPESPVETKVPRGDVKESGKALGYVDSSAPETPSPAVAAQAAPQAAPPGAAAGAERSTSVNRFEGGAADTAAPAPQALAKARRPTWEQQFEALAGRSASSPAEARELREEYRLLLRETTTRSRGDEVRIALVRAGARALALSGDPSDRDVLRRDARAYLELGDGIHGDEVRQLLSALDSR